MPGRIHGPSPEPKFGQHRIDLKQAGIPSSVKQGAGIESLTKSDQLHLSAKGGKVPVVGVAERAIESPLTTAEATEALHTVVKEGVDVTSTQWLPAVPSEVSRIIEGARTIVKMQSVEIDLERIIAQSTLGSIKAKALLEFLILGDLPSSKETMSILISLYKGLFVEKNKVMLAESRAALQKVFLGISEHLQEVQKQPPINPGQEKLFEFLIGDLLTIYPFLEAHYEESPILTIPQKVDGIWTNVTYNVASMELGKELKSSSPIYAYGLTPKDNEKANPLLLFMGTPPDTTTGQNVALWVDVIPEYTVGEALYKMSQPDIENWVNKAFDISKKPVQTFGKSLGGAMCLLTSIHCGNKVEAHAYNPPGLQQAMLDLHKEKYKDTPVSERPVMYIFSQESDIVSELIGKWPEGAHLFKIIPHEDQKSHPLVRWYVSHIRSFLGRGVQVLEVAVADVNNEDRRISAAAKVQSLCRFFISGITKKVRQKVVGNFDWASKVRAEKLADSSGKKQNRVDLAKLFKDDAPSDVNYHLHIALAEDKTYPSATPVIAGWGKVAVNVGGYQHVILNLESLSKRLRLRKDEIKEAEKDGTVHILIQKRLKELKEHQKTLGQGVQKFGDLFKSKTTPDASIAFLLTDMIVAMNNLFDKPELREKFEALIMGNITGKTELTDEVKIAGLKLLGRIELENWWNPKNSKVLARKERCVEKLKSINRNLSTQSKLNPASSLILKSLSEHILAVADTPKSSVEELTHCLTVVEDLHLKKGKVDIAHIRRVLGAQIPLPDTLRETLYTGVLLHIQEELKRQRRPTKTKNDCRVAVYDHIDSVCRGKPSRKQLTDCLTLVEDLHLEKGSVAIDHITKALGNQIPPSGPLTGPLRKSLCKSILSHIQENLDRESLSNSKESVILLHMRKHIEEVVEKDASDEELSKCLELVRYLRLQKGNVDIVHIAKALTNPALTLSGDLRKIVLTLISENLRNQGGRNQTKNRVREEVREMIEQSLTNESAMIECLKLLGDLHLEKGNIDIDHITESMANRILLINDPQRKTVVKQLQADIKEKLTSGTKIISFGTLELGLTKKRVKAEQDSRVKAYSNALTLIKDNLEKQTTSDPVLYGCLSHAIDHIMGVLEKTNPKATVDELRNILKVVEDFQLDKKMTVEHIAERIADQILPSYAYSRLRVALFKPLQKVIKEKIESGAKINLFETLPSGHSTLCLLIENGQRMTHKSLLQAAAARVA